MSGYHIIDLTIADQARPGTIMQVSYITRTEAFDRLRGGFAEYPMGAGKVIVRPFDFSSALLNMDENVIDRYRRFNDQAKALNLPYRN